MKRRKGFTLVELLVVIAIIALLMAIMVPALNKAKQLTKTLVCKANLRQYGISGNLYVGDNAGAFPDAHLWLYSNGKDGNICRWHDPEAVPDGTLWPYMANKDSHLCSAFSALALQQGCSNCSREIKPQFSYAMNAWLGPMSFLRGDDPTSDGYKAVKSAMKDSQVETPAKTFFFSEENTWIIDGLYVASLNDNNLWIVNNQGSGDSFATYHNPPGGDINNGSANLAFVDGHVETIHVGLDNMENILDYVAPSAEVLKYMEDTY